MTNYTVRLKKNYNPVIDPSNPYDYKVIKLVGVDNGCIRVASGYELSTADVYLGVPLIYNFPPLENWNAGNVIAMISAPIWAVPSIVGGLPIFTLSPSALGNLGDNQVISFYLTDGSDRSVDYTILVNVRNRPPIFDNGAPADIIVNYMVH